MKASILAMFLAALLVGCGSTAPDSGDPAADDPVTDLAPAPWAASAVPESQAPPVLLSEWRKAENRDTCAPLTFAGSREGVPRRANFSGGWAVAWDLPSGPGTAPSGESCDDCGRGQFGIAGTGVEPDPDTYDDWDHEIVYRDGSRVGYGSRGEGQWLAYVQVAGQRCLYNVWSYRGREHLEQVISSMRLVD